MGPFPVIVVIPTYWTWPTGTFSRAGDVIYDHPTPVDLPGSLSRILQGLAAQRGAPPFAVWVITSTVNARLDAAAESAVEAIISPFREAFPIAQFAHPDLQALRRSLVAQGLQLNIDLRGYPNVRNLQLIIPYLLGAETVVFLGDEAFPGEDYLARATTLIGQRQGEKEVMALSGLYRDWPQEVGEEGNIFSQENALMRQSIEALESRPGRLVESHLAFGDNMVLHRSLFGQVPFDPHITRGEDVDYLINARLTGRRFFLDKELKIAHHSPEEHRISPYLRLRQNVFRFIYEREKLLAARREPDLAPLEPSELDPYPGRFLREDVISQARRALEIAFAGESEKPEQIIQAALALAQGAAPGYFAFLRAWPKVLATLGQGGTLRSYLERKLQNKK
ncbi:MAG: glycosyltransferase family 2 protein [Anaerolineae bacterium]